MSISDVNKTQNVIFSDPKFLVPYLLILFQHSKLCKPFSSYKDSLIFLTTSHFPVNLPWVAGQQTRLGLCNSYLAEIQPRKIVFILSQTQVNLCSSSPILIYQSSALGNMTLLPK